jgi:hypothetical protein
LTWEDSFAGPIVNEHGQRLGDLIDDYCPRCRLLLNHAIASMVDGAVVKVICQTCFTEHPFRHAEVPQKKANKKTAALFEKVLAQAPPPPTPPVTATSKKKTASPARYISRHKNKPSPP